jgi:hypothetical protein
MTAGSWSYIRATIWYGRYGDEAPMLLEMGIADNIMKLTNLFTYREYDMTTSRLRQKV